MLGFLVLLFPSCDKEEVTPSYIHISKITLEVDGSGEQGSNAHDILDAWVYVNSDLIGVFELPATIPILKGGKQQLTIVAGIKKNGLNYVRTAYPFYQSFNKEIELIPSQVDTVSPVVRYRDNIKFAWLEDFEDETISLESSGSNTSIDSMTITSLPSEVFEYDGSKNKYSGKVTLPLDFQIFENSSLEHLDLPRSGQEIFLELNFKCNTEFVVGIYPLTGTSIEGVPLVNLFSTQDTSGTMQWKKIYISLKEDVNSPQHRNAKFKVFFHAQTNSKDNTSTLLFDNIKLIHF